MTAPVPATRDDLRSRIVDVATRLLQEHGPGAVTTRRVAEAAGVQAPTLYRLFTDKEGLLEAVAEHVLDTYVSAKAAIVAAAETDDVDPLDDLRAGWDMQLDFALANPSLFALLNDPGRGPDSSAVQAGQRVLEARVHRLAAARRLRVSERRAVDLIHAAGTGAVLAILATPPEQRDAGLAADLYEAVLRQILADAPGPAETGAMATTVAFRALAPDLGMLSDGERRLLAEWLDRAVTSPELARGPSPRG